MTLSEFTLRLILIFLPGLIAFIIIEQLTVHREIKPYRFVINSLLLGFLCYLLYFPISLIPFLKLDFTFTKILFDNNVILNFKEIFVSTILSIPLGFIMSFLINKKILHKIAKKLKVSKKFGDFDVWGYIMNSQTPEWVVVRDIENDLMYEGWIQAFSDSEGKNELFLRDVKVFSNKTAKELYEIPGIYLPQKRETLTIEFPSMGFSKYKDRTLNNNVEVNNEK